MLDHKRYTIILVSIIFIEAYLMLATTLYLQPPTGDIASISGYSENDFGWNQPKKTFANPTSPLQEAYNHYTDVLIVGDSFSFGGVFGMLNYPWQTFLTASTGLSVSTISHYTTKTNPPSYDPKLIPAIINSELFKKHPPKVFVLEVVERQLHILPKFPGDCKAHSDIALNYDLKINPIPSLNPTTEVLRPFVKPSLSQQIGYSFKYWQTFFQFISRDSQAYIFELTTPKLFSSNRSDTLLVYEGDVKKQEWDDDRLKNISCILLNMQNFIQANGKTLFVVMIAPDKLTAYSHYLKDGSMATISAIERLKVDKALHLPRFDLPIQAKIDEGVVDVYLPNDTHWAYFGQQVAADTLTKYLLQFTSN